MYIVENIAYLCDRTISVSHRLSLLTTESLETLHLCYRLRHFVRERFHVLSTKIKIARSNMACINKYTLLLYYNMLTVQRVNY